MPGAWSPPGLAALGSKVSTGAVSSLAPGDSDRGVGLAFGSIPDVEEADIGGLIAILPLVLINGFFVAAEFALVSSREERLPDTRAGRLARRQLQHMDEYLAACQVGVTTASLALGALGEPALAGVFEPLFASLLAAHLAAVAATLAALLAMTALQITIGEQAPKSFAIGSAERVSLACAWPLEVFHRSFRPLVLALNGFANAVVRTVGGTPAGAHPPIGVEEIRGLIASMSHTGVLEPADIRLLSGLFTLDERRLREIMTPRPRATTLQASQTVESAIRSTRSRGHSRFPVLDGPEELVGVAYTRELADALLDGRATELVASLQHPIEIFVESQPLADVLARLRAERASLGAVVDEHGTFSGVITIEDVMEEIVGEIWDEDDRTVAPIHQLSGGRMVCVGDTSLADLAVIGVRLGAVRATTLNGLIQERLGRFATRGDSVGASGYTIAVLAADKHQVKRALIAPRGDGA